MKILIIFLLIIVGVIGIVAYVLGAARRLLGISPKQAATAFKGFKNMRNPGGSGNVQKDILYEKNDVVVLRGEAVEKEKVERKK
ncbi:MAG: hypothetical protein V4642_09125 [Bacteroidota bacterium]